MKRIFYFTGHRMSVFHWSGKQFSGACSFEPDADGFAKFEQYLKSAAKMPTRLLVDVIEEDFRIEAVPRVYGKDRAAVITRLIDRHYRSSRQFTYSEIIARDKHGRRDNQVLLGAITNPDLIQPWLDVIERCAVPLSGIWTLPLVSKKLLPMIGAKKGPVLLVSQQVNSNLRQTFFRDGKMITSRQSVINVDAENIREVGKHARPEVERTIHFLRSQRRIGHDESLHVHILVADEQLASIRQTFAERDNEIVHIHRISELEQRAGFKGYNSRFADGLFAWLCMNLMEAGGHYGDSEQRSRYFYSLLSGGLYAASIALLVAGLLLTEAYISDAIEYERAAELLAEQEKEYQQVYRNKFAQYEEVFANAAVMNTAVELAHQIEVHSRVTPLDMMLQLSHIIENAHLDDISIDAISWKREQVRESGDKQQIVAEPVVASADRMRHVAVIEGRLAVADNDYAASVARIGDIVNALRAHQRVEQAEVVKMPVEVRPEKKFTAESGTRPSRDSRPQGSFSLRVVMKGVDDA